jgi:hypothetical protein
MVDFSDSSQLRFFDEQQLKKGDETKVMEIGEKVEGV